MAAPPTDPPFPSIPILLVDDEPAVVEVLGDYLEEMGLRIFRALNGTTALTIARENPEIQLAVLDYSMPDMNGMAVLAGLDEIRQGTERPMKVVFLSAQVDSRVALEIARSSAFYYLSKPVNLKQLLSVLRAAYASLSAP